ncbi:hypothetical protein Tco_0439117 [Tanacetum coccineum]
MLIQRLSPKLTELRAPEPDDPYVAVRQAQLVDTELEPMEAPSESKELQSLGSRVPLMSEDFEAFESSARVVEAMALSDSTFHKRFRSSYETPLPYPTLPMRKRYREDEGPGIEGMEKEVVPEGQQQAVVATDTTIGELLGLGHRALRRHELAVEEDQPTLITLVDPKDGRVYTDIPAYVPLVAHVRTPPSPEWPSGSLLVLPSSLVVPSPIALPVATPTATISCLDALPPTLFANIDRDVRKLYTRLGAVKYKIFSQRYRLRNLKLEQERVAVTFRDLWRLVFTLEAWAGQTDA